VITEVTLKVHPQPEAREFRAYIFKDMHTAMQAGATLMRSRLGPCAIRLYDETETKTHVSKVFGMNLDKGAYIVFGFDGRKDIVACQMKAAREIMEKQFKGKDLGSKGGEWWWENKYKFFYPGYMFHVPQAFGTLDTVADFAHIEKVYWAMKNVVNKEFPDARFIGHFSHWYEWGCMLYARFIFPGDKVPPNESEAAALYNAVWDKAIRAAIANGGVINEHHGVGLKLGRYVKDLYGTAMPVLEGLKKQLDPNGIMNPGKLGFAGC
jgi:alkyldihydroxyacetonephosphate synthase